MVVIGCALTLWGREQRIEETSEPSRELHSIIMTQK